MAFLKVTHKLPSGLHTHACSNKPALSTPSLPSRSCRVGPGQGLYWIPEGLIPGGLSIYP